MKSGKYHILFLTRWYPNPADVQLGIFIRKHALAVSKFCKVSVLYVQAVKQQKKSMMFEEHSDGNFAELKIFYRASVWPFVNFSRYVKWHIWGFQKIKSQEGKPQLIHLNVMYGLAKICRTLSKSFNIPYIITEHWHGFTDGQFGSQSTYFKNEIYKTAQNASAFTCVSEYLKQHLIANNFANHIEVIPNVVDVAEKNLPEVKDGIIRFLTAADLLDRVKNVSAIIKVIQSLIDENEALKFEYHIIGGGEDEMQLKALAHSSEKYRSKIIFHGRRLNEYVLEFLNACNCAIINSNTETFSVFAAEAVLCGKPVICTRCGGPEDFLNEKNSILIEKNNSDELKNAVKDFLNKKIVFDATVIKNSIGQRFSSQHIGQQFLNIYSKILSGR